MPTTNIQYARAVHTTPRMAADIMSCDVSE